MSRGTGKRQLNWGAAEAMAYRILRSPELARTGTEGDRAHFPLDSYWTEPLQNAVLRTLALWRKGEEMLPETTTQLAELLARRARHNDDNQRKSVRRRKSLTGKSSSLDPTLSPLSFDAAWAVELFRVVASRDMFEKLIARLYDALDNDARAVLDAWLVDGVEFSATRALMHATGISSARELHNIKRRIKYRAGLILVELGNDGDVGGVS